jgi:hypothetical protein
MSGGKMPTNKGSISGLERKVVFSLNQNRSSFGTEGKARFDDFGGTKGMFGEGFLVYVFHESACELPMAP